MQHDNIVGMSDEVLQHAYRQAKFNVAMQRIILTLLLQGRLNPWKWARYIE